VHNRFRIIALSIAFVVASVSLYIGIGVYALTLGPKAVGDYMRDRLMAGCLIALAMLVNVGTAWVLAQRGGGFLSRLTLSLLATVAGSILMFGLIVARVIFVKGLSTH
jgi:hypothetical protein